MSASTDEGPRLPGMGLAELLTVRDQTDTDGRLLLEDSAPRKARRRVEKAGVAMKTVPCPYADSPSRQGGVMNISAYEALRQDTAEVLNGVAWLRDNYLRMHPPGRGTVQAFFDTSNLGITLPLVLFYRGRNPVLPHGQLPSYIASIFKASRGVFSAAVDMLNRSGPPTRVITAAEVMEFADRHGHFRRDETKRVCAAPTRLIERCVDVFVTGEGGDARRSALSDAVDFPTLWDFYRFQDDFGRMLSNYRFLLEKLNQAGMTQLEEMFGAMVPDGGRMRPFGEVTDAMVQRANAIQEGLNALLGRRPGVAPLRLERLVEML
ncbi:MAG: hypothetical protein H0T70_11155 [Acidimicrobiia bacterium]|nr:hypothetical protein [Acidimicrobiia bacterium]